MIISDRDVRGISHHLLLLERSNASSYDMLLELACVVVLTQVLCHNEFTRASVDLLRLNESTLSCEVTLETVSQSPNHSSLTILSPFLRIM